MVVDSKEATQLSFTVTIIAWLTVTDYLKTTFLITKLITSLVSSNSSLHI